MLKLAAAACVVASVSANQVDGDNIPLYDPAHSVAIPRGYPGAGKVVNCDTPELFGIYEDKADLLTDTWGDGSACKATIETAVAPKKPERCALYGNLNLPLCDSLRCSLAPGGVDEETGPYPPVKACCPQFPVRMWTWGDGSACKVADDNGYRCHMWGNEDLPACEEGDPAILDGRSCPPGGFGGKEVCCPYGQEFYGDGSACRDKPGMATFQEPCALWGNYKMRRCPDSLDVECTVVKPGFAGAGQTVCCPDGDVHVGDGSACRHAYSFTAYCALYGNGRMTRCSTAISV